MLKVPMLESHNYFPLNEENIMATYCHLSTKLRVIFFFRIHKIKSIVFLSFSFPTSIFNPEV